MNFKQCNLNQKPFYLLMVLGFMLWVSSAAALAPIQELVTQSTPTPTLIEDAVSVTTPTMIETEVVQESPTPTPFPDWAMTSKDTNGLLFAGILILLIITVGTLAAVTKNMPEINHKKNR